MTVVLIPDVTATLRPAGGGRPVPVEAARHARARSRAIAERVVRAVAGDPAPTIVRDARGRPTVSGRDRHGRDLHMSVSHLSVGRASVDAASRGHTGDLLAVAVGPVAVGLDVEHLRHPTRWRALHTWLVPPEARRPDPTPAEFLRRWTAEEAVGKLLGTGLAGGPRHLALPPALLRPTAQAAAGVPEEAPVALWVDSRRCWVRWLPPWRGATICLATAAPVVVRAARLHRPARAAVPAGHSEPLG